MVLPARAGMILRGYEGLYKVSSAPRTSGDDPNGSTDGQRCYMCSPHERG